MAENDQEHTVTVSFNRNAYYAFLLLSFDDLIQSSHKGELDLCNSIHSMVEIFSELRDVLKDGVSEWSSIFKGDDLYMLLEFTREMCRIVETRYHIED